MPQRNSRMKLIDDLAIILSNRTTEAGAITGVVGWLASINWIGWTGVLIALVGLASNIHFQRRRDRREREHHRARMAALHDRCDV